MDDLATLDTLIDPAEGGGLPFGWSIYEAAEIGVTNYPGDPNARPHNIVENEEEIVLLFGERPQPTVVCGYCGDTLRTTNLAKALRWYREGHSCLAVPAEALDVAA